MLGVGITAGWGETEVLMDVSSRRLALVKHRNLPARGLLSLSSLLRAFLLTVIKRNQAPRENACLKIARLELEHVSGASSRTHAARGPNRAQRARDDAGAFLFHQHGARSSPSSWRGG